eukprot:TRINITY_DN1711_c0_g1_i4.p3 TRINITY_DN1711_c0_g1~~TRINITY_DN1711_c0_g1_i4.p3  ORF type:complete len:114 (-),score=16.68 TRINITY_DN1711_c0_g1_i4:172-513(-)
MRSGVTIELWCNRAAPSRATYPLGCLPDELHSGVTPNWNTQQPSLRNSTPLRCRSSRAAPQAKSGTRRRTRDKGVSDAAAAAQPARVWCPSRPPRVAAAASSVFGEHAFRIGS